LERIQSAIAKARAARQGQADPQPHAARPAVPGGAADMPVRTAWAELPEVRLDPRRLQAGRIVAHHSGVEAAAYDMMRTNLMRQMRDHGWTRVAVTSPGSACGKTTTCLNLAFSLARQADLRVMVLELDLRRPSMARLLGLKEAGRFAEVLDGSAEPEQHLLRIGENLVLGTNAAPVDNPAELLHSTQAAAAIDAIEARYKPDIILFDTPPALASDDTLAFLDQVDCALIVAAAEQSTVGEIDRCGTELAAKTQVLGVILNKCRFMDVAEGYGHGDY
jgi:Mrp family chromosome partitioning ATPase